jgi:hypothetical protein
MGRGRGTLRTTSARYIRYAVLGGNKGRLNQPSYLPIVCINSIRRVRSCRKRRSVHSPTAMAEISSKYLKREDVMSRGKNLSPEIIDLAIAGVEAKIRELEAQRADLLGQRSGAAASSASSTSSAGRKSAGNRKGRKMSAAARRLLSEKLKARWAERKAAKSGKKAAAVSAKSAKAPLKKAE